MYTNLNFKSALVGLVFVAVMGMADSALAITIEVAKKCDALTAEAYPPREIGNPAAGSAKGTGRAQRAYYKKCVANKGKVPAPAK